MRIRNFAAASLICLVLAVAVFAADVTGKWTAQVPGRGGQTNATTFTFKASGSQLTGTMTGPQGAELPIEDGKVSGDDLSFVVTLTFGGNSIKFNYKGKVVGGDEIQFTREGGRGPQTFTAKRAS